jgi:hypothetical protein
MQISVNKFKGQSVGMWHKKLSGVLINIFTIHRCFIFLALETDLGLNAILTFDVIKYEFSHVGVWAYFQV